MKYLTVDSVEDGIIRLEDENGKLLSVSADSIQGDFRNGDVIREDGDKLIYDEIATNDKRKQTVALISKLKNKKKKGKNR